MPSNLERTFTLATGQRHTLVVAARDPIHTQLPASGPGFYTYGPANHRFGQAHVVEAMTAFAAEWAEAHPDWIIGIGDLSLRGGGDTPRHTSHEHGLNVDIRPLRSDGHNLPVTISERAYSRERTRTLAAALLGISGVSEILFNDGEIEGVHSHAGHNNHLHLSFRARRDG